MADCLCGAHSGPLFSNTAEIYGVAHGGGGKLKAKEKEEEINRLEGRQAQMLPPAAAAS